MKEERRSGCPISICLELFGDRWTLLILRNMVFFGHRYFVEFRDSKEGIASNILSERLARLERRGIVTKNQDPDDGRRHIYGLTDAGLDLIPLLLEMMVWGVSHGPGANPHPERVEPFRKNRDDVIREYRDRLGTGLPESVR